VDHKVAHVGVNPIVLFGITHYQLTERGAAKRRREGPMGKAADQLLSHMPNRTGYDLSYKEVRDLQIEAMNERVMYPVTLGGSNGE
jgi:hypothetical protein